MTPRISAIKARIKKREKTRWAISGLGNFAGNSFLPAVEALRGAEVSALYSRSIDRAKTLALKFDVPEYFDDFEQFLKSDFDILYVAGVNAHHHEQVIKAAEAGKHILCEKPLALDAAQAEEMVAACKKNGVFLAVDYVMRFHPLTQKARELIRKNKIGKPISISANFNVKFAPNDNYRFDKALAGGGAMRDLGTHLLDLTRFLFGEIEDARGEIANIVYKGEVDDFGHAILKFENGARGYINCSFNAPRAFNRVEIVGHKGSISIDGLLAGRFRSSKLTILLEGETKKAFRRRANRLYRLVKSVTRSIRLGEEPEVTGEDGLINMRLMEKIERG
jgi:D-xylose 1-dehydrogenase (NADP+, D-xylono-1,5-lactone-forming)